MNAAPPNVTCFLIKVASRCNLACDYCYVYEHADQGWREQPASMSERVRRQVAERIAEYVRHQKCERIVLVLHGGEPLLAGVERLADFVRSVRVLAQGTLVDATVQTNGTLLDEKSLDALSGEKISVSISVDGPKAANDRHRLDHAGRSSFRRAMDAVRLAQRTPDAFAGVIAVIDPTVGPDDLLTFFDQIRPPALDLLLPDATHVNPPPGRDARPDLYERWLLQAFDLWFDRYPHLPIRTFDGLLETVAGLPSRTDAFGLGDVSLLTIETDGTYHDLDVLKITEPGRTTLGTNVFSHSVREALRSERIVAHRSLLTVDGLADTCRSCRHLRVCGGGSVPHRFSAEGFRNPSVYCREMDALISHIERRLTAHVSGVVEKKIGEPAPHDLIEGFDCPDHGMAVLTDLTSRRAAERLRRFDEALRTVANGGGSESDAASRLLTYPDDIRGVVAAQPSAVFWADLTLRFLSGGRPTSIDGVALNPADEYVRTLVRWAAEGPPSAPRLHRDDPMLRMAFGRKIDFETREAAAGLRPVVSAALAMIGDWQESILDEIGEFSPEIQFVSDPSAHPDKAVSFSDNAVPGTLYIGVRRSTGVLRPVDLVDSIVHEHRHQRLYLLQSAFPIVAVDAPLVHSPWRAEPRPPSGLYHAVYVFCGLLRWWRHVSVTFERGTANYAREEASRVRAKLKTALPILRSTALTSTGRALLDRLESEAAL